MKKKLSLEEVMHVANLAKINISLEEAHRYQMDLSEMINEIDKIKEYNDFDSNMMYTPSLENVSLIDKEVSMCQENLFDNAPKMEGNFVEVPVMLNE